MNECPSVTNDERLRQFAMSSYLSVDDKSRFAEIATEIAELRRKLEIAQEALKRISRHESSIKGMRPEMYGHASTIALTALDAMKGGA